MIELAGSGLIYSIRPKVVAKYFGQLCIVLAIINFVPFCTSILFKEPHVTIRYAIIIAIYLSLGLSLARINVSKNMQPNEGMILIVCTLLFSCLITSYPIMAKGLSFENALFEVISAITSTGLSTVTTVVGAPHSFLFERAWMQWYGTLGFVTVAVFLVMQPGLSHKILDDSQIDTKDLAGGTRAHAFLILKVSCSMLVISVVGCWLFGLDPFNAILYGMTASCSGGFAPSDSGIADLNMPLQIWICVICLTAAIPLTIYSRFLQKRQNLFIDLLQAKTLLILCIIFSIFLGVGIFINKHPQISYLIHNVPIFVVQSQTATGFTTTIAPNTLDPGSKLFVIFSMLIGGCVGSTSGGIKILRLLFLIGVLNITLRRLCMPKHVVAHTKVANILLQDETLVGTMLLIMLYILTIFFSWLIFVSAGINPIDSLFEITSATSTTGLSVGVTDASLPLFLKCVLGIDMLFGRMEILAWLLMFYPGTWFSIKMEST